ncbi:MAG: hypothetical protein WBQ44_06820 [Rhodococcus sp. (in: high G+C Gram-positive bacteria)]
MSDWTKKIREEARGLIAEAEQELTVLEGGDTVDLTADEPAEEAEEAEESAIVEGSTSPEDETRH